MDKLRGKNAQRVVIAMSGGVDSSVAAALLKKAGVDELRSSSRFANARVFDVVGVFMKFWSAPHHFERTSKYKLKSLKDGISNDKFTPLQSGGGWNRCCSPEAEVRARKVAKILKVPFYVFNFEKEFKKRVVDYFLKEYKTGRTPNPCVICNKEIKFGLLLEKAMSLGADFVATGHYARKEEVLTFSTPVEKVNYKLLRAKDKEKDQSYFLWMLSQKQLKRILFPIGNFTKKKVRELAKKFSLPVLDVPESQEICFIQTTVNDFLAHYLELKPGPILTQSGKKIGQHQGLIFYTIGQRKGIKLSGGPFYVIKKDFKKNALIVTPFFDDKSLYQKSLIAKKVNWLSGKEPKLPLKIAAQIRYRHKPFSATITKKIEAKSYKLILPRPQRAITPGQSVVFYLGQELLAGGIIC